MRRKGVKRKRRARHLTIVSAKMPLDLPPTFQAPMDFFERPILNSPYAYPGQHWELENGLPTNHIVSARRGAELLSPIPKAKKQKAKRGTQATIEFGDKTGLEVDQQKCDLSIINRGAGDTDFDVLIACAFNYDAHSAEFDKLGHIPVLKARMNADLHMSGEVKSDGPDGIACWFIDTDYNEESFFVRHVYFLGANDSYKALKTTLKAEVDEDAWASLHGDTSRPFEKPKSGGIAVKVINHLGDEVMKVFRVE
jgi:hypothetical protein